MKQKVTHHIRNQKKHNLNEGRQSTDANAEMNQMLELPDHDLNSITINI